MLSSRQKYARTPPMGNKLNNYGVKINTGISNAHRLNINKKAITC